MGGGCGDMLPKDAAFPCAAKETLTTVFKSYKAGFQAAAQGSEQNK